MKKTVRYRILILACALLCAVSIAAKSVIYSQRNYFISKGINISANALYYFGDADNGSAVFSEGLKWDNLSIGGGIAIGYTMPVSRHCNLRYTLLGGALHGNNEADFRRRGRTDFRRFRSVLLQPAFGVEIYPCPRAGFYLYGGVAVTGSLITKVEENTYAFLPMVQVGLGYSWRLGESWALSIELMLNEGLVDRPHMNLDGYPTTAPSQSNKNTIRWNDGWYQLGLTASYRLNPCKKCRILNNYNVTY